jgi:Fe-S cluster assembly ATP-binding protein
MQVMKELQIVDLHVSVEDKEILKGVTLTLKEGDTLALLGPNGHGKSTLLNTIMGHPRYKATSGKILLDGEDVLKMSVDQRSKKGLFMAFQTPPEVPGVESMDFFKEALNAHRDSPIGLFDFYKILKNGYAKAGLDETMNTRHLNEGFSGGEKKRNEILQMELLNPAVCMLDEIDSGLDVDALKLVSEAIEEQQKKGSSFIIISHYARLFSLAKPNRAAIMINGRIAVDGKADLVEKVDKEGYEWIKREYGIEIKKEEDKPIVLETCAVKKTK